MRMFWHPARRHHHEPLGADYTRASMPFLIAICVVALILIFLPEVVMLVPDLIFGKR
jgi:TRAP-type transport system large permease protein